MMKLVNAVHPGEVLFAEFLEPAHQDVGAFAAAIGVDISEVINIIEGRLGLTAEHCRMLSGYFGNSAEFWERLQANYDDRIR